MQDFIRYLFITFVLGTLFCIGPLACDCSRTVERNQDNSLTAGDEEAAGSDFIGDLMDTAFHNAAFERGEAVSSTRGCGDSYDEKYPAWAQTPAGNGYTAKLLLPDCFAQVRHKFGYDMNFVTSLATFSQIGSGSGISGAKHFLSGDGRFYLKTIPEHEAAVLEKGNFLKEYTQYLERSPNTLLVHMAALILFHKPGTGLLKRDEIKQYLLVMDNYKQAIDYASDSFVEFDLKGSKWKHRLKSAAGRRCSPEFPLEFWSGGVSGPFRASGEDLDFAALRTQADRTWLERQKQHLKVEKHSERWTNIYARRLRELPLHDECLGGFVPKIGESSTWDGKNTRDWIDAQAAKAEAKNKTFDFCKKMRKLSESAEEVMLARNSKVDVSMGLASCRAFEENRLSGTSLNEWAEFVRREKASLEEVRVFFGIPTEKDNAMQQVPMVLEHDLRKSLMLQIEKDSSFLRDNSILDYSMGLIIINVAEGSGVDSVSSGSIFSRHKGGMRAAKSRLYKNGDTSEHAVYIMKIMDILSPWTFAKTRSIFYQSFVKQNKIQTRLAETLDMITAVAGKVKCKYLKDGSVDAVASTFCWSSCSGRISTPKCDSYEGKLKGKSHKWTSLAQYSFVSEFAEGLEDADGHTFSCRGWRYLCAATLKGAPASSVKMLTPKTLPRSFRQVSESKVDTVLKDSRVLEILGSTLNQRLTDAAPLSLKRVALMTYMDFARHPYKEDTIRVVEYAERFRRYFEAWTDSPEVEDMLEGRIVESAATVQGHGIQRQRNFGRSNSRALSICVPLLFSITSMRILAIVL